MTPEQFAYWLQGFAEVHGDAPNAHEWQVIKDHLATIFVKVTPPKDNPSYTKSVFDLLREEQVYKKQYEESRPWTKPDIIC